ncbi:MAG: hypothetical protein PWQ28_499 [Candidatus Woesearchaeota archaeon]|nr:hypothetical protein [Candidatus Woesearchaeota archaeon]
MAIHKRKEKGRIKIFAVNIIIVMIAVAFLWLLLQQLGVIDFHLKGEKDNHSSPGIIKYNDFIFKKELVGWSTLVKVGNQSYELMVRYNPEEVEYIEMINESKIKDRLLSSDVVFITTDPFMPSRVGLSAMEISKILNPRKNNTGILGIPSVVGVTYIPAGYDDKAAMVIDCYNASEGDMINVENRTETFVSVIRYEINETSGNRIFFRDDCIIISGENVSVLEHAGDRMVYSLLNVI